MQVGGHGQGNGGGRYCDVWRDICIGWLPRLKGASLLGLKAVSNLRSAGCLGSWLRAPQVVDRLQTQKGGFVGYAVQILMSSLLCE